MLCAAVRIQSGLSKRAAAGSDIESIVALVVSMWSDIDVALAPIIGHRGVAALFHRTLHLVRRDYPWLTATQSKLADPIDFAALQPILAQQTGANVVTANGALVEKFLEQLASLIGESLTERLLHAVVDTYSTGDAA